MSENLRLFLSVVAVIMFLVGGYIALYSALGGLEKGKLKMLVLGLCLFASSFVLGSFL